MGDGDAPQPIGPYAIDPEIERGAMGVVCLGRDERLGRLVAVEVLPRGLVMLAGRDGGSAGHAMPCTRG